MSKIYFLFLLSLVSILLSLTSYSAKNDIVWIKYGTEIDADFVKFSKTGELLAVYKMTGNTIKIFSVSYNSTPLVYNNDSIIYIYPGTFSADHQYFQTAMLWNDSTVKIRQWPLLRNDPSIDFSLPGKGYMTALVSPSLKYVAGSYLSDYPFLYDVDKKQFSNIIKDPTSPAYNFAYSSDGDTLAVIRKNSIQLYNLSTGFLIKQINYTAVPESYIEISPGGKYLSVFDGNSMKGELINIQTGSIVYNYDAIFNCVFSDEDNALIYSPEGLFDYKISTQTSSAKFKNTFHNAYDANFLNGKTLIAYPDYNQFAVFDFATGDTVKIFSYNNALAHFSNRGNNIYAMANHQILKSSDGSLIKQNQTILDVLPDTTLYYKFNAPGTLEVYDIQTDKLINSYNFTGDYYDATIVNMSYCYLMDADYNYHLYELKTSKFISKIDSSSTALKFSKNNKYFAYVKNTPDQLSIVVRRLSDDKYIVEIPASEATMNDFCFSPDENYFYARVTGENIKQYSLSDGSVIKEIKKSTDINHIASVINCSLDGVFIIESNYGNPINIYNINDETIDYTYNDYSGMVSTLEVSPDGNFVLVCFTDGTMIYYKARFGSADVYDKVSVYIDEIKIYPNILPGTGTLNFNFGSLNIIPQKYEVVSIDGITLTDGLLENGNQADYSLILPGNLPSGKYFIKFYFPDFIVSKGFFIIK